MMITIDAGKSRFNHRTAGVFIDEGHVLLHRLARDDFWALPGGRVELMENTEQTVVREMKEEIDLDVQVERLLWVAENYFSNEQGQYHEVGFYYLLSADRTLPIYQKDVEHQGTEFGVPLIYKWFRLDELPSLRLFPAFLKEKLQQLPAHIEHIVFTDEDE
ncbi:hypothetical protein CIG75_09160 [Tumebacillus algifaecis]|uniref:Nudix hydrolase domain-containing protein n=1 Tax=Tumebacillus algifaecis TaxID=1214604 RepID=A0A223D0Q7_9BACL|nr:NUDIX hydrolase [Tumebacillus algifaecis]ASS75131.1 hypothetical protein CIG75_09160 [Tumebacillus algifaecis]